MQHVAPLTQLSMVGDPQYQPSTVDIRSDVHQLHQLSSWQLAQFKRVTGLGWRSLDLADHLLAVAAVTAMLAVSGVQLWLHRSVACSA